MELYIEDQLYKQIRQRLISELDPRLTYHNWEHTETVMRYALDFGMLCGKSRDDLRLLQTAALFHDSGYLTRYRQNEEVGCEIASRILPAYQYTENEIKIICRMIVATSLNANPEDDLEQLLADADLGYLAAERCFDFSMKLRKEWELIEGITLSEREWVELELKFLSGYKYHHPKIESLLRSGLDKNIEKVKELIKDLH